MNRTEATDAIEALIRQNQEWWTKATLNEKIGFILAKGDDLRDKPSAPRKYDPSYKPAQPRTTTKSAPEVVKQHLDAIKQMIK